jgi:hypothetical protein
LALAGFFGGWLLALARGWPGWLVMAAAMAGLWLLVRRSARKRRPTRYRPLPWRGRDWLLLGAAATPLLVAFLPGSPVSRAALYYSPYPRLTMPTFDAWLGLAVTALALPALVHLSLSPPHDSD